MKPLTTLILLVSLLAVAPKSYSQDTIAWKPNYKLKWADFKGQADSSSENVAITVANIGYSLSYNSSTYFINVKCVFEKRKSWTKTADSAVLSHEQGHFDISEIYARKLRKAFKEYVFNPKTIEADFKMIFNRIRDERRRYNELYDIETNSSRNRTMQVIWENKIAEELKALKAYAQ
ncbi:MAG TPA: hypothetical protein VD993_11515 [Chitinophagaceae bacterium]|nr:hypothetical protein [Chitinophagaceae bacterium]